MRVDNLPLLQPCPQGFKDLPRLLDTIGIAGDRNLVAAVADLDIERTFDFLEVGVLFAVKNRDEPVVFKNNPFLLKLLSDGSPLSL
jgi:hypothetical protein